MRKMQRSRLAVILCLAVVTIVAGEENTTDQNVLQQADRAYGFYRPNNGGNFRPGEPPCAARLAPALEAMRRLEDRDSGSNGVLELRGVSLHQPLQGEPTVDMYVTDMKIKGLKQTHLERCRFSRGNSTLSTTLMLPELLARGTVRLRDSSALGLLDWLLQPLTCNMTIRCGTLL
ncbi:hypothetical protein B566_EDAN006751 [Ephemera danica]|nr:hypothetical protein B566_EDAN006751 [Ephemera danica]